MRKKKHRNKKISSRETRRRKMQSIQAKDDVFIDDEGNLMRFHKEKQKGG